MSLLSSHFSYEELTNSDYALRHGIDNTPSSEVSANLILLATGLDGVRSILGYPLRVNSGYRCPKLNSAIGGAKDSAHTRGLAADFTCPEYGSPQEIAVRLAMDMLSIGFDQLIYEGTWVHIGFSDTPRYQVLTAHFGNGPTTYTKGIA